MAPSRSSSLLTLVEIFDNLDKWDVDTVGSSASVVVAAGQVSFSLSYCENAACYRSEIKQNPLWRETVLPHRSGVYWFGFRMRVPLSWVWAGPTNGVSSEDCFIFQLLSGDAGSTSILSIRLRDGNVYRAELCGGPTASQVICQTFDVGGVVPGEWVDWVIRLNMNYDSQRSGSIDMWMDLSHVLSTTAQYIGYESMNVPYLKLGLMQNNWKSGVATTTTNYEVDFDEVRVGGEESCLQEVSPSSVQGCADPEVDGSMRYGNRTGNAMFYTGISLGVVAVVGFVFILFGIHWKKEHRWNGIHRDSFLIDTQSAIVETVVTVRRLTRNSCNRYDSMDSDCDVADVDMHVDDAAAMEGGCMVQSSEPSIVVTSSLGESEMEATVVRVPPRVLM